MLNYSYTLSDLLDSLLHKQAKEIKNSLSKLWGVHRTTVNSYMKRPISDLSLTQIKVLEAALGRTLPQDIDQFNVVELIEE